MNFVKCENLAGSEDFYQDGPEVWISPTSVPYSSVIIFLEIVFKRLSNGLDHFRFDLFVFADNTTP